MTSAVPLIETQHLVFRAVREDDLDHIWEVSQIPGFTDGMYWNPPSTKDEMEQNLLKEKFSVTTNPFVITDREGNFIGRLFLVNRGEWEIGYWIHPTHQRKGYATEAAKAAIQFAFESLGATRVRANSLATNLASKKVIQKLGMTYLGDNPEGLKKNGKYFVTEEYVLERE